MVHPNSLSNLKRFNTGESGNPAGTSKTARAYRLAFEAAFSEALATIDEETGRTRAQVVIDRLLSDAEAGKPVAQRLVCERLLPALQSVDLDVDLSTRVEVAPTSEGEWAALVVDLTDLGPGNKVASLNEPATGPARSDDGTNRRSRI